VSELCATRSQSPPGPDSARRRISPPRQLRSSSQGNASMAATGLKVEASNFAQTLRVRSVDTHLAQGEAVANGLASVGSGKYSVGRGSGQYAIGRGTSGASTGRSPESRHTQPAAGRLCQVLHTASPALQLRQLTVAGSTDTAKAMSSFIPASAVRQSPHFQAGVVGLRGSFSAVPAPGHTT
jgi:hypothetical protein